MKLVYLGTPDMAVAPLRALVEAGHDIVLVVTGVESKQILGKSTGRYDRGGKGGSFGVDFIR